MWTLVLLTALSPGPVLAHASDPAPSAHIPAEAFAPVANPGQGQREEFDRRFKEARGDREKLWDLHRWTEARSMRNESRRVLREILKVDEGDPKANELLGHLEYDGRWFKTQAELDAYKQEKAKAEAIAKGYVEWNGEWVAPEDLPYRQAGLVRASDGSWMTPEDAKRLESGWLRQDLEWIAPEEAPQLQRGLWKCGEQWLDLAAADIYHSEIDRWWRIPTQSFHLYTTLPRKEAEGIGREIDLVVQELRRFFGTAPLLPRPVLVLRSQEQYAEFAGGVPDLRAGTESHGLSSVHGAYFADAWFDWKTRTHYAAGVTYFDASNDAQRRFGRLFVRHAAGLSFAEGIDPSPKTTAAFQKSRRNEFDLAQFYGEKRLHPLWRHGAAAYVERYFIDRTVTAGADTEWTRRWSVQNLERRGGIPPLDRLIEMRLDANDPDGAAQLLNAAGLVVAFLLDGGDEEAIAAHRNWQTAFLSGGPMRAADQALFAVLKQREAQLRAFAKR